MNNPFLLQITVQGQKNNIEAAADVPSEEMLSLWSLAQEGGVVMIIISILSVFAIYIFVERFLAIKRASKEDVNFMNKIKDFIHGSNLAAARSLCQENTNPIARMIEKGISRIGKPLRDIGTAIETVGKLEINKLESNLATLATIAGAAPMLGFLGTVIGMIKAFHEMHISGNSVEISQLSGGIMQAMVTTVAGLIVGIVAYIGYNMLVARVEKVIHAMEARTMEFLDLLEEPAKN
ncbi:MAG TPA: MotA/TolQ/ExbB proton channel family protein [Flavobacteriales bacterium]|nr:MotA/TolQ/ExbB proton channel family protein [Flavobacteriales bacterium]